MASGIDLNSGAPSRSMRDRPSSARFVELVDQRRQESLRYNHSVFARLQNWYNSYRGYWQGRLSQFRNNVSLPFTFAMIQSDVARKVQTTFGAWPIVTFEGYAPEDVGRAKKNEVLISAQMKDCGSLLNSIDFMLQADICGTAIARYGWKHTVRKSKFVRYESIAPGLRIPVLHEQDSELFNGPTWKPVDRLDFWQQPAKNRIEDMDWAIERYWLDLDEMMDDAAQADSYFDPAAVRLLQQAPLTGMGQSGFTERRVMYRNEYDYTARQNQRFSKPCEVWEMHGTVPAEFAIDGIRDVCIAIGNGRVVLKHRPSQFPGRKPWKSYAPMPDPYSFDGVGKAEVAYGPQMTANRLANQKLDVLDQQVDPMYIVSNSANLNSQNLFTRAGRIILVDGAADESSIRAMPPNLAGVQAAYQEIGQLWQFMQLGAGINDIIMGLSQGDRETARGFLGRQENVMTRLSFEARILEEQFVEPLANEFRNLDRVMLDMPHEIKILGSLASVNPTTGLPYQSQDVSIDEDDLAPDYRARAVGASQMLSRSVRQQNLVSLLQVLNANPAMMQIVNWANFARQALQLFDFQNIDELLVQQVPMVNAMAQENGMDPMAIASMASQPLQGLNPELIQMLGNHASPSMVGSMTGGAGG
jgi:hypothetical protein